MMDARKTEHGEGEGRQFSGVSVAVVGAGRVGTAIASLIATQGGAVDIWSRHRTTLSGVRCHEGSEVPVDVSRADLIVIAVSDRAVTAVARKLQSAPLREGCCVVHTSGAHGAKTILSPLGGVAHLGTLHPLVAIRSAEQGIDVMPSAYWMLEGHDTAVALCARWVESLGARWVRLDAADLALYHASAVVASNHAVALWTAAGDTLRRLGGLGPRLASEMLWPLLASTLDNVRALGLPDALTGPLRRGDVGTIREHLRAIEAQAPRLLASYRADAILAAEILGENMGRDVSSGKDLAKIVDVLDVLRASAAQDVAEDDVH
ncbi:MAG: DUF2520 domain-containing protein [Deltaproteobacteria bacterium]|nr:DUF2520 domain-containing protein [Deltaproteobacteria bacterium]